MLVFAVHRVAAQRALEDNLEGTSHGSLKAFLNVVSLLLDLVLREAALAESVHATGQLPRHMGVIVVFASANEAHALALASLRLGGHERLTSSCRLVSMLSMSLLNVCKLNEVIVDVVYLLVAVVALSSNRHVVDCKLCE